MARTIVDPHGRTWKIRRRWVHRTVSWRGPKGARAMDVVDGADLASDATDLPVVGVVFAVIAGLLVAVLAVFFVIPAVIFVLELAFVLVVIALAAAGRVLFRRPWTIEARVDGSTTGSEWKRVGWRASGELIDTVAERLRSTGELGEVMWRP